MMADRRISIVLYNQSNFYRFMPTCSYWSRVVFSGFHWSVQFFSAFHLSPLPEMTETGLITAMDQNGRYCRIRPECAGNA